MRTEELEAELGRVSNRLSASEKVVTQQAETEMSLRKQLAVAHAAIVAAEERSSSRARSV